MKERETTMFKRLKFEHHVYLSVRDNCDVELIADAEGLINVNVYAGIFHHLEEKLGIDESIWISKELKMIGLETWQDEYHPEGFVVCDGFDWKLEYEESDSERIIIKEGSNAYPWCFYKLIQILIDIDPELGRILGDYEETLECFYDKMQGQEYDLDKEKIVEYLESHIGERICSRELIIKTGSYRGEDQGDVDYFKLHKQVLFIAEDNDFDLDMSSHYGKYEGLPYNLDFEIKKWRMI